MGGKGSRGGRGEGHRGRGVWVRAGSLGGLSGCGRILSGWVGAFSAGERVGWAGTEIGEVLSTLLLVIVLVVRMMMEALWLVVAEASCPKLLRWVPSQFADLKMVRPKERESQRKGQKAQLHESGLSFG